VGDLSLIDVEKRYGSVAAVAGVSFDVAHGRLAVLVGPSGCGKTTTLRLIAGLERADGGRISIAGGDVGELPPHRRGVAMVFQSPALYPHKDVAWNLAFALRMQGMDPREIERRVKDSAHVLGLGELLARRPEELSGGEQQRVALGKAIVQQPRVWLLDEPLASLDAPLRRQLGQEIVLLQRQTDITTLFVTHDQEEALTLADWLIVMQRGRVLQAGTPGDVYARPANRFVATFLGDPPMNVIRGRVEDGVFHAGSLSVRVPADVPSGTVDLGIRPEAIGTSAAKDGDAAASAVPRIDRLEFRGHAAIAHVRSGEHLLAVRTRPGASGREGDAVRLTLPRDACHFFAATEAGARLI
jgi:ABC-type sugar transport system ATPase subunit